MTLDQYANILLEARGADKGFGTRWVFGRFMLAALAGLALFSGSPVAAKAGFVVIGFFVGTTIRDVRDVITTRRKWPLLQQLIDWSKVEAASQATPMTSTGARES